MSGRDAETWRVRASAKVNLTLRVLGIRADGYHELRTTFQSVALHDTLTFERIRGPFALSSDDPGCPATPSNLVWKAAASLWAGTGRRGELSGVRVHIRKRIPIEAGLGGGSSDAAATLMTLRALWRMRLGQNDLADIASGLGADVPFFLEGGTALGVERGDLLFPLRDRASSWVVIARPDFGVSTRDAYRWWDAAFRARAAGSAGAAQPDEFVNDLQAPVCANYPYISSLVNKLRRSGASEAMMSGSGSAVFGLFADRPSAAAAASALESRRVRTWLTRTTGHREHLRRSTPRRLT